MTFKVFLVVAVLLIWLTPSAFADDLDQLLLDFSALVNDVSILLVDYRLATADSSLIPYEIAFNIYAPAVIDTFNHYVGLLQLADRAVINNYIQLTGMLDMVNTYNLVVASSNSASLEIARTPIAALIDMALNVLEKLKKFIKDFTFDLGWFGDVTIPDSFVKPFCTLLENLTAAEKAAEPGTEERKRRRFGSHKNFKDIPGPSGVGQNTPNPFNLSTEIRYTISIPGRVIIRVYRADGALVRTLLDEHKLAGEYAVFWDGLSDARQTLATGVYFYVLEVSGQRFARKAVLLK